MANLRTTQFPGYLETGIVELRGSAVFSGTVAPTIQTFKGVTAINRIAVGTYALSLSNGYPTNYPFTFTGETWASASSDLHFRRNAYNLGPGGTVSPRTVTFQLCSGSNVVDPPYPFSASFGLSIKNSSTR